MDGPYRDQTEIIAFFASPFCRKGYVLIINQQISHFVQILTRSSKSSEQKFKLRYWVQNGNVTEEALKKLVQDDIIGSINKNQQVGNITQEDALKLKRYTQKLAELDEKLAEQNNCGQTPLR